MVQRYDIEPSELQTSEKQHSSSEIFLKKTQPLSTICVDNGARKKIYFT